MWVCDEHRIGVFEAFETIFKYQQGVFVLYVLVPLPQITNKRVSLRLSINEFSKWITFIKISLRICSVWLIWLALLFQSIKTTWSLMDRDAHRVLPSRLKSDWILPADFLMKVNLGLKNTCNWKTSLPTPFGWFLLEHWGSCSSLNATARTRPLADSPWSALQPCDCSPTALALPQ